MKEYKLRVEVEPMEDGAPFPTDEKGNRVRGFDHAERLYRYIGEIENEHVLWYLDRLASNLVCGRENTRIGFKTFELIVREPDEVK